MMRRKHLQRDFSGFSLIELLVTLTILSILASITIPMMEMTVKRTKEQELKSALRTVREAIDAYKQASDEGRITKSMDTSGYPPNLQVLVTGVIDAKDIKKRKIYFLRKIPVDPMTDSGEWALRSYKSPADRPEPGEDVFDVYSSSDALGTNGTPYYEW
jgi:general secretion pathway protein G